METESSKIIGGGSVIERLEDENGRLIEVRKLSRRETMRLMRSWGPAANVEAWLAMAVVCASVHTLDNRPIPMPQTPDQVEGIAEMLKAEGFRAIEVWFQEQAQQELDLSAARLAAKNSQRTPN